MSSSLLEAFHSGTLPQTTIARDPGSSPESDSGAESRPKVSIAPAAAEPAPQPVRRKRKRRIRIPGPAGEWLKAKRMRENGESKPKTFAGAPPASGAAMDPSTPHRAAEAEAEVEEAENAIWTTGAWAEACRMHQQSATSVLACARKRRFERHSPSESVEGMRGIFWCNLEWLRGMGYKSAPVSGIVVMLDAVRRSSQGEATALLRDASGAMLCSFTAGAVYEYGAKLHDGAVLMLRDFAVFTLVSKRSKRHEVNITLENIQHVWEKAAPSLTQSQQTPTSAGSLDTTRSSRRGGSARSRRSSARRRGGGSGGGPQQLVRGLGSGSGRRARRDIGVAAGQQRAPSGPMNAFLSPGSAAGSAAGGVGGGVAATGAVGASKSAAAPVAVAACVHFCDDGLLDGLVDLDDDEFT